jgi:F-type H+-transporting ATPase subunit b
MCPFFLLEALPPNRMFALDQQTIVQMIFVLVNAIVLAFVLSKLLYKPVLQILHDRKKRILSDVRAAEEDKAEALKLKAQYEKIMMDVEQEKQEILEAARKAATERKNEQLAEARSEAEAVKARAYKEIEMEQDRAKSEMKQAVINVSSVMVTKFLTQTIDADIHDQLFNETMAELEEISWHS